MDVKRLAEVKLKDYLNASLIVSGILMKLETRVARNNSVFASMVLRDKEKDLEFKWFDYTEKAGEHLVVGKIYAVGLNVNAYDKGKDGIGVSVDTRVSFNSTGLPYIELDEEASEYMYKNPNTEWAIKRVDELVHQLKGYQLYSLVEGLLNDNFVKYTTHSAARSKHHAGYGGLIVHSASVCDIGLRIAEFYNSLYGYKLVDTNLLISGGLLHDIGKLYEINFNNSTGECEYSALSALESHIVTGIRLISAKAANLDIHGRELDGLIHLISSHHGRIEYGSPVTPATIEAKILAEADMLDAEVNKFEAVYRELSAGEITSQWITEGYYKKYYKSPFLR